MASSSEALRLHIVFIKRSFSQRIYFFFLIVARAWLIRSLNKLFIHVLSSALLKAFCFFLWFSNSFLIRGANSLRTTRVINFYVAIISTFSLWFFHIFAQFEQAKKYHIFHVKCETVKSFLQGTERQKTKQIIYSWCANNVNSIRFIVLPISKKLCHKSRRRSYLEFIRIAFRYAQIFFRYEPVSFLFRFMWVFLRKQWVVTFVTHPSLQFSSIYDFLALNLFWFRLGLINRNLTPTHVARDKA